MPSREEIQEGVAGILNILYNFHLDGDAYAKQIIEFLHSQGVVIRVDNTNDLTGCCIARLEPLIEEVQLSNSIKNI